MVDPAPTRPVDDETAAALTLFNEYLNADREREKRERRVKKAERAKDDAAAVVREMERSDKPAAAKAEAEAAYRKAAEDWKLLREGKKPEPAPPKEKAPESEPEGAAAAAEETPETESEPTAEETPETETEPTIDDVPEAKEAS
jgi:hypothetical protein